MRAREVLAIAVIVSIISMGAVPASIDLTAGLGISTVVWQSTPSRFADVSYWLSAGLSAGFGAIDVSLGISLLDFETFQLKEHPSINVQLSRAIGTWRSSALSAHVGVVWNPYYELVALAVGVDLSWTPIPLITVSVGSHVEVTPETNQSPAGLCFGVGASLDFRLPVL